MCKANVCNHTGCAAECECFGVSLDFSGVGVHGSVRNFLRETEINDCSVKW